MQFSPSRNTLISITLSLIGVALVIRAVLLLICGGFVLVMANALH